MGSPHLSRIHDVKAIRACQMFTQNSATEKISQRRQEVETL